MRPLLKPSRTRANRSSMSVPQHTWGTEMELLFARVLDGFNNGLIYGFLALGLVIVFRGTGQVNMAQGEMAMFCAFIAYSLVSIGIPIVLAVALAVVAGVIGGGLIERILIRPLGHDAEHSVLLVSIGLFLAIN